MQDTLEKAIRERQMKIEHINWREIKFLQQEHFKEMPEGGWDRLKASLVSNQFSDCFKIWQDENGVNWCLDGKHRSVALEQLVAEGYKVPYLLPAIFYNCANKQEAAKLVLLFSAAYARMTQQGLYDFTQAYNIDFSEVKTEFDFANLSFDRFEQKFDVAGIGNLQSDQENEQNSVDSELNSTRPILVQSGDIWQLGIVKHQIFPSS